MKKKDVKRRIAILIFFLLISGCLQHSILPIKKEEYTPSVPEDIFIIYSHRKGGGSFYKIGNYYGYDVQLTMNGEVTIYTLYYRWKYEVADKVKITGSDLNYLDSLFKSTDFINLPESVPLNDSKELIQGEYYQIAYKPQNSKVFKTVTITSVNSKKEYFPPDFIKLHGELYRIIFRNSTWKTEPGQ